MGEWFIYASLEKGIAEFRSAKTGRKSHLLADFFGLLLITFTYTKRLMRPYAQFTWSRPIRRPNGVRTSPTVRPAATFQHVLRPMEAAAARRKRLVPAADQAWQGASPLQRRLAVATATTLRRPPHPLRRTGTAQHHLSPMRASSAKRHNAGGERARARRKAAWCRCRKASFLAPPALFLAK